MRSSLIVLLIMAAGATDRASAQQPATATSCTALQVRFVDDAPQPTARRYLSALDGRSYALRDTIVLDGRGVASIEVRGHRVPSADSAWDVVARLTPTGARALSDVTGKHVGQSLAVLLDDELVENAVIESSLSSAFAIRSGATHAVADSLATRARRAAGVACSR